MSCRNEISASRGLWAMYFLFTQFEYAYNPEEHRTLFAIPIWSERFW
jgi:hypothetical protein